LIKQQNSVNASEARCHLLGDLAARAAGEGQPDLRQWAAIEQALAGRSGFLRRRWLVLVFPALAGLALCIGARQTLGHVSQGCTLGPDGSFSVPDARECTVTFDEGTRITLGKASSGRLHKLWFRSGAQLDIQSGHADLSVVHRRFGRWEALAGPFAVRVTGTKFEVDWAPGQGRFGLTVSEGKVSANGGPLRDRTVRAGHRIEVDTATGHVIEGDLGEPPGAQATPPRAVAAESPEKAAAESAAPPALVAQRRRGAPSRKTAARNLAFFAEAKTPTATPETPAATPELAPREWTASSAADDQPAPAPPGPRRLTVGRNGELVGGVSGPVRVRRGSGTEFSKRAHASANHLYLDDGSLCTSGKTPQLACMDEVGVPKRCDWDTNWGVLIMWHPREDQKAWGSGASSSIALEFRGKAGHYRLVAHRAGDPAQRAYCVANYRSGGRVKPSDFEDCRGTGGSRLPDFTKIDYFALQLLSEEAWLNFKFCLSAISLP
jgi:hypothetical protein